MRLREGQRVRLLDWWRLPNEEQTGEVLEPPTRGNPMTTVRLESGEVVTGHRGNFDPVSEEW